MQKVKKNKYTVYGINNVTSLVQSKKYDIDKIYIIKDSSAYLNKNLKSKLKNKNIVYCDNKTFLNKFSFKHTQGIAAIFQILYLDFIINSNNKNLCYVIIDQMNDPQNLGQIIRTCECAGVDGIILPKHGSVHITDTVIQVSQGAFFHLDFFIVSNLNNTISYLKDNDFWIIGIENSIDSEKWHDIDYKGKVGIVFGSEGSGIRRLVKKSCDFLATIPMSGKINSLNISAAVSAILFERNRQLLK